MAPVRAARRERFGWSTIGHLLTTDRIMQLFKGCTQPVAIRLDRFRPARLYANTIAMAKQETLLAQKKRRGPAPTGINPMVGVRIPPPELAGLDAFIAKQKEPIGRPEAIRRILTDYLKRRGLLN